MGGSVAGACRARVSCGQFVDRLFGLLKLGFLIGRRGIAGGSNLRDEVIDRVVEAGDRLFAFGAFVHVLGERFGGLLREFSQQIVPQFAFAGAISIDHGSFRLERRIPYYKQLVGVPALWARSQIARASHIGG